MLVKKLSVRTWIEIDRKAAKQNYQIIRSILDSRVEFWAVVKSNAYGHGLVIFSKLMEKLGIDGFCVDSLIEGLRLRENGIRKPILVLGPTLPFLFSKAAANNITLSISNFDVLNQILSFKNCPKFHLKIDTGMHRQGFLLSDISKVIKIVSKSPASDKLSGIFTHFASAKDINYPTYTEKQFSMFNQAAKMLERAGYKNLVKHCSATGGTLINKKYHLDAVRIGIGLYGYWPSRELEIQIPNFHFKPVLSWKTIISEVKKIKAGEYVGYDLTEKTAKPTKIAILPIGYWHGYFRSLSGVGEVIVKGKRARVLGRVSMDLLIVDVSKVDCQIGDVVTLIGRDGKEEIRAEELATRAGTSHYEFLTRINPLIKRLLI